MKEIDKYTAILGVNGVEYYTYYTVKKAFGTYFFHELKNAKEFASRVDPVAKHTVTEKTWKTLCERILFED